MRNRFRITAVVLSLVFAFSIGFPFQTNETANAAVIKDVSAKVELLGNPFTKSVIAKNVWDMQTYNGRVYLGHGDFNTNAGPIPVVYYDPSAGKFITQYTVNEEEINQYKVLNGKLYIPGTDAREDWSYGNFYTLEDNDQWAANRTIPNANHVYDLAYYNGRLYAATGTTKPGWGEVLASDDMGKTWTSQMCQNMMFPGSWATTLFELNSTLYASGKMYFYPDAAIKGTVANYTNMLAITGTSSYAQRYSTSLASGISTSYVYYIVRPMTFNNSLVYLSQKLESSHYLPNSMYVATGLTQSRKVTLPETAALPSDLLVRDNTLYTLAYVKNAAGGYTNIVYQSSDLQTWSELFRFQTDTFARSFEELNGDFYFGLGCDTLYKPTSTGNILRVAKGAYQDGPAVTTPESTSNQLLPIADNPVTEATLNTQPVLPIIIDNTDSNFISNSTWSQSSSQVGYYGSNYLHDNTSGIDQNKWAMWCPTITVSGQYNVYMRWTASTNRPSDVPLEIKHADGTDNTKTINQQINNGTWVLIGTYTLAAGSDNYVKLYCSSSGYTIADTVKFEKQ